MESNKRLGRQVDWVLIPYLGSMISGSLISVFDFIILQNMRPVYDIVLIVGIVFVVAGTVLRYVSRRTLVKAGMEHRDTPFIKSGHDLVTSGVYRVVRHPLYLGEITRLIGFPLMFKSLYGGVMMLIGIILLIARIEIEEKHLIEYYGDKYREYMDWTWRLIPWVF